MAQHITRNREDAEDVVQQSLQKAFIHLKTFAGQSLFSTWLTRIVINEALMVLRKRRGTREVPIAESTDGNGSCVASGYSGRGPKPRGIVACGENRRRILSPRPYVS